MLEGDITFEQIVEKTKRMLGKNYRGDKEMVAVYSDLSPIEGHTDSIGTNEYNQKLSERRAQFVENEFKQNITTDKIKYETRGYGEERPIADNATKEGRAKNRRVEINFGGTIEN